MIPLAPKDMLRMWKALAPFDFEATFGAFKGLVVRHEKVKSRVLESMKIQVRGEGWEKHELLDVECA